MNLKDLINDTAKYPDTMDVDFGGEKVPLGSLRQFTIGQLTEIEKRSKEADKNFAEAAQARQAAFDLSTKAQKLYDDLQSNPPAREPANAAGDGWDTDPYYAPVRKRFDERDKKLEALTETLKKLEATQQQLAVIGGYDRWQRQWDGFPKAQRPKDKSLDDVIKYASENKLLDRWGIPSVELALDKMTAADREAVKEKEAYERGAAEMEAKMRATTMPRPNYSPSPAAGKSKQAPLENFDELTDKALADPELARLIQDVNLQ